MGYQLAWEVPDMVLCLKLDTYVSMDEFAEINDQVNAYLDERKGTDQIILKIDAVNTKQVPQDLSRIRYSQTYANRLDVKLLLVIGENKYVRLIMMLTFNLSRAMLQFADNHNHAKRFLRNVRAVES